MPPARRKQRVEVQEEFAEFDDDTDHSSEDKDEDDDFEEFVTNERGSQSQREKQPNIEMIDDEALFGVIKKLVSIPDGCLFCLLVYAS